MKDTRTAESPPHRDTDNGRGPDRGSTTGTPRWVKVFGIIGIVVVLLVAGVSLTGGGGSHGPGRHTPPSGIPDHGSQQP